MIHHSLKYYDTASAAHWAANRSGYIPYVLAQLNDGKDEVRVIMTPIEAIEFAENLLSHAAGILREPPQDWDSWESYWKARDFGL